MRKLLMLFSVVNIKIKIHLGPRGGATHLQSQNWRVRWRLGGQPGLYRKNCLQLKEIYFGGSKWPKESKEYLITQWEQAGKLR